MQVVHDSNHWVLVAKGFFGDHVTVYDSLAPTFWNRSHTLSCMSSLLQTPEKQMSYVVKSCQQQNNGYDCGVFVAAYATSLAHGVDPNSLLYDRRSMRKHLRECSVNGRFTAFPSSKGCPTRDSYSSQADEEMTHHIDVNCYCRRTEHRTPSKEWDMVQCDTCGEWYHRMCHRYPEDTEGQFHCDPCTNKF
jgi:hypothetical protein